MSIRKRTKKNKNKVHDKLVWDKFDSDILGKTPGLVCVQEDISKEIEKQDGR